MNEIVESATIIAGQARTPMCYVCDKPRAVVEYAWGSVAQQEQEARTGESIQTYYQECRQRGAFVGD